MYNKEEKIQVLETLAKEELEAFMSNSIQQRQFELVLAIDAKYREKAGKKYDPSTVATLLANLGLGERTNFLKFVQKAYGSEEDEPKRDNLAELKALGIID